MTKAKKAKAPWENEDENENVSFPIGKKAEKQARIALLRDWSKSARVPEGLREILRETADVLEWEWFPPRRGPKPKTRWQTEYEATLRTWALNSEVHREEAAMKERGEREPRRRAEEAVAQRHNISRRRLLQKISRN